MKENQELLQEHFNKMLKYKLFKTNIDKDVLFEKYLGGFESNPVFRDPESSVYNCNNCRNFLNRYGNIVAVDKDMKMISIFDIEPSNEYKKSFKEMAKYVKSKEITNIFLESESFLSKAPYSNPSSVKGKLIPLGIHSNSKIYSKEEAKKYGVVKEGEVRKFHHFSLVMPVKFVVRNLDTELSDIRASKEVFKRGLDTLDLDTLKLVSQLIKQGSLLNGETYLSKVDSFCKEVENYSKIPDKLKDNYAWSRVQEYTYPRFRNELIGVLCKELAEGEDLNKACLNWNKRVDPANYMKAVAPITEAQRKNAQKFVEDNGYTESFNRRMAVKEDINVSEILHVTATGEIVKTASIFDKVKTGGNGRYKRFRFNNVEEVGIEKFMKDILPDCTSVELFLENRLSPNMVTLTTSTEESKQIFKWDNSFSWTYNGDLAGVSQIKDAVKTFGGDIEGDVRFSIKWANRGDKDNSDLDAHCNTPCSRIYFSSKKCHRTKGFLDVDITNPSEVNNGKNNCAVENITFPDKAEMMDGEYMFYVHNYFNSNSKGFQAELEIDGEIFEYNYNKSLHHHESVKVARILIKNGKVESIKHHLTESSSEKEIYGIKSNNFHKVNLVCLSPNYWGKNNVGHKHYLFMLDKCQSPTELRGFHNENLTTDLLQHRKVLDVLGAVHKVESIDNQLSGVGFNATVKDEVILKLKGKFQRIIKVKF